MEDDFERFMRERASIKVYIPFVVTASGEFIPIQKLKRLSSQRFNDVDGLADELARSDAIPLNHLFAKLDDGSLCVLDLDNPDFQNALSNNQYGIYSGNMGTPAIRDTLIRQFARDYENIKLDTRK